MCYNVSVKTSPADIENLFDVKFAGNSDFAGYFHISAFTHPLLPVITNDKPRTVQLFNWGLIPHWVKNEKQAAEISRITLNARAESLFEKPSFKESILNRRCLVPVDGFFEWKHVGKKKYPYFVHLKNTRAFALGGIWDEWVNSKTGEIIKSFSIITTEANPLMAEIHNSKKRMPLILLKDIEKLWLSKDLPAEEIKPMLRPVSQEYMEAYTVKINSSGSDSASSLLPFRYEELY